MPTKHDHDNNKMPVKPLLKLFAVALVTLFITLLPIAIVGAASPTILINAIYYDTYLSGEPDEAFQLINVSASPIDLTNWTATDFEGTVTLISILTPGATLWVAREADGFYLEFGFKPAYEYQTNTDPAVPDLVRSGTLLLANPGDQLALRDASSGLTDAVIYGSGATTGTDWIGATITPYEQGVFGIEGQILYRKLNQANGRPVPDTDAAADWAQATDDDINGKKVRYPGWDLDRYFFTHQVTQTTTITYVVAPDAIYDVVADYAAARVGDVGDTDVAAVANSASSRTYADTEDFAGGVSCALKPQF